jgi:hypothetical protein
MSKCDFNTPGGCAQGSRATRIGSIDNVALNDATGRRQDPDREFFKQHPQRLCYVRHLFAHERADWAARGAVFDQPGTIDLVVVRQFADNSFRVRLPFAAYSVGLDPNSFSDTKAQEVFEALLADRTLESPEGKIVSMRAALKRLAEATMRERRRRNRPK